MKKRAICSLLFALIFVIGLSPAVFAAVPKRPQNQYVLDSADVLSDSTERRIISENQELFEECGAQIVVAAVDFLGGESIEDYTYKMFKEWGVGSSERNNGILLVLAIGEDNYYVQAGYGIDDYFDGEMLSGLLSDYLEPDFASGDYDEGVKKIFGALLDEMEEYYREGPGTNHPTPRPEYSDNGWDEDSYFSGGGLFRGLKAIAFAIIRVIIIVVIILFVFSLFRGFGGSGPRGGGGGGFWRGMWLGSMMNRRRTYWGVPPPPPPPGHRPGGFGGPPPRGGFGGFGGGSRGGFHGGGGSRGGGAGRSGGGFHGGGGSHGGGAGRH